MKIKKDDSFRKLSIFERRYADLCVRAENYSPQIPVFDAARRFFHDYFRIKDPYELRNKIGEDLLNIGGTRNSFFYISESGMFYAETDVCEPFAVTDDIYLFMQWVLSR